MPRQSISFTQPNDEWLKTQVENQEYASKSELINDLIRQARNQQIEIDWIKAKLDKEEKELLESIENNEWQAENVDLAIYKKAAQEHFKKNQRISLRINEFDLKSLQKIASMEGIPYQTFITSLIHKYVSGKLVEVK